MFFCSFYLIGRLLHALAAPKIVWCPTTKAPETGNFLVPLRLPESSPLCHSLLDSDNQVCPFSIKYTPKVITAFHTV